MYSGTMTNGIAAPAPETPPPVPPRAERRTAVVMTRMPRDLHERMKQTAWRVSQAQNANYSLNTLCLEAIERHLAALNAWASDAGGESDRTPLPGQAELFTTEDTEDTEDSQAGPDRERSLKHRA